MSAPNHMGSCFDPSPFVMERSQALFAGQAEAPAAAPQSRRRISNLFSRSHSRLSGQVRVEGLHALRFRPTPIARLVQRNAAEPFKLMERASKVKPIAPARWRRLASRPLFSPWQRQEQRTMDWPSYTHARNFRRSSNTNKFSQIALSPGHSGGLSVPQNVRPARPTAGARNNCTAPGAYR